MNKPGIPDESHPKLKLHAILELRGKTATGLVIPEKIVSALGSTKKPQVSVTLKGYTYRTSIASMGGEYMLPVSAEIRDKTGVRAGEEIDLEIELDTLPREIKIPDDFQAALDDNSQAKSYFEKMSYSSKRRLILPVEDAKTADTRQRRIVKTIELLKEGKA